MVPLNEGWGWEGSNVYEYKDMDDFISNLCLAILVERPSK
jgi:hypothetical protein